MIIAVCNFAAIPDRDVERVCAAINRQLEQHFKAHWSFASRSQLQLLGSNPDPASGDAIIYLWDQAADVPLALAEAGPNDHGLPFGFVILEISEQLEEPWSVTLVREALALIGDMHIDNLSEGLADPSRVALEWYEVCEAVEAETYGIDRVAVASSLRPSAFVIDAERVRTEVHELHPFGGYLKSADNKHRAWLLPRLSRARRATAYRSLARRATLRAESVDS